VKYTLVVSTAIALGCESPDTSVAGIPPPSGTLITVPFAMSVQ